MLRAIELNKAGRNLSDSEVNWRLLFNTSEDSLTSTIFERLFYLPRELFWEIITESAYDPIINSLESKIESIEFWPHWDAENSNNINFVEPDVFLRTSKNDIIIEAKRWDYDQQREGQWKNELESYFSQYGAEQKDVYLFALGGINHHVSEFLYVNERKIRILKFRWIRILNEIISLRVKLTIRKNEIPNYDSTMLILDDLILGFRIHGFSTGEWFEKYDFSKHAVIKYESIEKLGKNIFQSNLAG